MELAIDAYFLQTDSPRISELCLYLGFNSRQSLYNCETYGPEYMGAVKRARLRMEDVYEKQLAKSQCAGAIFALKNLGWRDVPEGQGGDIIIAAPVVNVTVVQHADSAES